jgi:hypothetical protein
LQNIFTLLEFIPFCASFFIFIVVSKAFRSELKRMIGKKLISIRNKENRQGIVRRDSVELNVVNTVVLPA